MRAVKAVYEDGNVSLTEPVDLKGRHEVTVLIPEPKGDGVAATLACAGMLEDFTPEQQRNFDEALSRRTQSPRQIEKAGTKLRQNWAGGIRRHRDRYSALELQKKALEWRGD